MFSFRQGILRIDADREQFIKNLYCLIFFLNEIGLFALYRVTRGTTFISVLLFMVSFFLLLGRKNKNVVLPYNTVWFAVLTLYCFASLFWAKTYDEEAAERCWRLAVIWLTLTSISIFVDTVGDLERLMKLYIAACVVIVVLEFSVTPFSKWSHGLMGRNFSGFNVNDFGIMMFFAETFSFYFFYEKKKKLYFPLAVIFVVLALSTSCRKAFFCSLLAPVLVVMLSFYKKRYIRNLLLIVAVIGVVAVFVMSNEDFYLIVGRRIESMFEYLFNNQTASVDGSMYERAGFITVAKSLFAESPVFGNGIDNFAVLASRRFGVRQTYSHNNYWQLLSELGIVGFIIYYSMYVYCFIKLGINIIKARSRISILFFVILILQMVMEVAAVSFTSKLAQIDIALLFCATYVGQSDGRLYSYRDTKTEELQ